MTTSSRLCPNLYTFLVGHPGVGKTRSVRAAKAYMLELPEPHIAPTSLTGASLVDALLAAKRTFICLPDPPTEYNSIMIACDEIGAFMHKYDDEMVAILSAFYDLDPYGQNRRGNDIKIKIKSPQVSILAGSTPSNLVKLLPENAWEQGFTSRVIMIYSNEKIVGDDFAQTDKPLSKDLIADLKQINTLSGAYKVTEEYRTAVNHWRALKEPPVVNHPKLLHYATRRRVHLYKLSMISAASKSNTLLLTKDDFNTAMGWLIEAEAAMPEIFQGTATSLDGRAMEEIYHYVCVAKESVPEAKLVQYARERVPAHSVMRVLEVMERSGMIIAKSIDKSTGLRWFGPGKPN